MRRTPAFALLAAAALAGCGSSSSEQSSKQPEAAPAAPKGSVKFVAPEDGAKTGPTLKARVALTDFRIAPGAVGQAPRPGEGHLHFKLDEGRFDRPRFAGKNGLLGKKLGVTGHYSPALTPAITYRHLPPGKHELEVYLANNNHTNVGVEATLHFTVR